MAPVCAALLSIETEKRLLQPPTLDKRRMFGWSNVCTRARRITHHPKPRLTVAWHRDAALLSPPPCSPPPPPTHKHYGRRDYISGDSLYPGELRRLYGCSLLPEPGSSRSRPGEVAQQHVSAMVSAWDMYSMYSWECAHSTACGAKFPGRATRAEFLGLV